MMTHKISAHTPRAQNAPEKSYHAFWAIITNCA